MEQNTKALSKHKSSTDVIQVAQHTHPRPFFYTRKGFASIAKCGVAFTYTSKRILLIGQPLGLGSGRDFPHTVKVAYCCVSFSSTWNPGGLFLGVFKLHVTTFSGCRMVGG